VKKRRASVRLYLLGGFFVAVVLALWVRLVQVQYVDRARYRSEAAGQTIVTENIQPVRGCIFDRHGRPLALNVRKESVYLNPALVTNPNRVAARVSRLLGIGRREVLSGIRSGAGFIWLKRQCRLSKRTREELLAMDGVEIRLEQSRVYPYGDLAAKIIGLVDVDNVGRAGVEAAFEDELRGVTGTAKVLRNGRYERERYYRFVQKEPRDGRHIYLTIDTTVQQIAEARLRRAIEGHGARSGVMIVMDARTGEILALAEAPSPRSRSGSQRADSLWTIRALTHVYEPGSTFKLVTTAALLDLHRVAPTDTFDAENGSARVGPAVIRDPHPYGRLSFEDAFAYSSNIVFYKLSEHLEDAEFFKYIRLFGFGERTGIELLGESPGTVTDVAGWSARSKGTIAFGQEIAVTPLQMISAFAVVANDGAMVLPRLVRGVAEEETGELKRSKPVKVRRVVRRATARTLMDFCRRAVVDGTGEKADVGFMTISGKTGTSQKAAPRGGYLPGKYVSSFIGFAPHDDPRIVCLIMLDEPRYASRFGGISCAPEFAALCRQLANATDVFDGVLAALTVPAPPREGGECRTPNFIRMERSAALEYARELGCNALCQGDEGRVVAQSPGPGTPMDRDEVVRLVVSDGSAEEWRVTPDLRGMPVRKAKVVAARHGFRCTLVGSGIVRSQAPAPGSRTGHGSVRLYCDAGRAEWAAGGSP
jgi:stage V sporulation protein D (sporulation-specific penicillin-binding protein)